MMIKTEMHLTGKQARVIATSRGDDGTRYEINLPRLSGLSLEQMQKVLGELLDDIFELGYMSTTDGEAYCSPLIRDFEEGIRNANRADADGAHGA